MNSCNSIKFILTFQFASASQLKKEINHNLEICELKKNKIQDLQNDWEAKIAQQDNRLRDIQQAKLKLSKINSDKENLLNSFGDGQHIFFSIVSKLFSTKYINIFPIHCRNTVEMRDVTASKAYIRSQL